eukprot:946696-Pelagomonas_calceolata.AAC.1
MLNCALGCGKKGASGCSGNGATGCDAELCAGIVHRHGATGGMSCNSSQWKSCIWMGCGLLRVSLLYYKSAMC